MQRLRKFTQTLELFLKVLVSIKQIQRQKSLINHDVAERRA
jgi:hypothetical protein